MKLIRKRYLKQHKIKEKNRVGWGGGGEVYRESFGGAWGQMPFRPLLPYTCRFVIFNLMYMFLNTTDSIECISLLQPWELDYLTSISTLFPCS